MRMNPTSAALALLLAGCTHASPDPSADVPAAAPAPFLYGTVANEVATLTATSQGAPLAGVSFLIRVATTGQDVPGELLLQCTTGADGGCSGQIARLIEQREVDVLAIKPGFRGPYGEETRRAAFGPFGPAAWVRVRADELATFTLALEAVSP